MRSSVAAAIACLACVIVGIVIGASITRPVNADTAMPESIPPAAQAVDAPKLKWKALANDDLGFQPRPSARAAVEGGWLVLSGGAMCFVPDPDHSWDGNSPR